MDYNTTREDLPITQYGRNVQKLISYAAGLKDKKERTKIAQVIIRIMGQMTHQPTNLEEFKHKLWDHLYILSNYDIDIESPYPAPAKGELHKKPAKMTYSKNRIRYRHYGKNVITIMEKTKKLPEDKKAAMTGLIANYMKLAYRNWSKENVSDEHIAHDIEKLSEGGLKLSEDFTFAKIAHNTNYKRRKNFSNNGRNKNGQNNNRKRQAKRY